MNTFVLRPDLQPNFGDQIVRTLNDVAVLLKDADPYVIATPLRNWTATWMSTQKIYNRDHFDVGRFVTNVQLVTSKIAPVSEILVKIANKLQHHTMELLSREGTAGNTQTICIIELCTLLLQVGILMNSMCLTLGSDDTVDLDEYMDDVLKQIKIVRKEFKLQMSKFEGAFLVTPPKDPVSLAHVRGWIVMFVLALSMHLAVYAQPQKIISILMADHPIEKLIRRTRDFVKCVESVCSRDDQFEQTAELVKTVIVADSKAQIPNTEWQNWYELTRNIENPAEYTAKNKILKGLQLQKWRDIHKKQKGAVEIGSSGALVPDDWNYWVELAEKTNITRNSAEELRGEGLLRDFQTPRDVWLLTMAKQVLNGQKKQAVNKLKETAADLLKQNQNSNVAPHVRQERAETILKLFANTEQRINKELPINIEKMEANVMKKLQSNPPPGLALDESVAKNWWKQPETKRHRPSQTPSLDAVESMVTAFGQEVHVGSLVDTFESQIKELIGQVAAETPPAETPPPPHIKAVTDLLGPDPANTVSVVKTSSGNTLLPHSVRSLAAPLALAMLFYPNADKVLSYDRLQHRLKACSQKLISSL